MMMTRKALFSVTMLLGIVEFSPRSVEAQQPRAAAMASQICASCHGPEGNSSSPAFPRLAGQTKDYLQTQLKAFRDHTRADPMAQAFMWGMAAQLNDQTIAELADYFSSRKPASGKRPDPKLAQAGRDLFEHGIPNSIVQPCMICHGAHGEGNGVIPRLAGQHQEYLLKQLALFKTEARADANSPLMHQVSQGMTFDQMMAVSAYISGGAN
jgi:cytochrome c553